jgi:hypothetical protein
MDRCYNAKSPSYPAYGGAGVGVCVRWHDKDNFLDDMGPRPTGTSLDRVDNAFGYSPANCRWATIAEQNANRKRPRLRVLTPATIAEVRRLRQAGMSYESIGKRGLCSRSRAWEICQEG